MAGSKMASLAKDTAIYGVSSIIGKFINYVLTPLYTNVLKAQGGEYGAITKMYAYTALCLVLLTFGMETTMFRFANKEGQKPARVYSTALISVGILSAIFAALCIINRFEICAFLNYPEHPEYVTALSLVVAIDSFQAIVFSYLRFLKRPIKFAALKLTNIFMTIALNLIVILWFREIYQDYPSLLGWYNPNHIIRYVFYINLFCSASITIGLLPEIFEIRNGFDRKLFRQMLSYTWPILILGLAGLLNQVADKICFTKIITGQRGEELLGIYGSAVKVAMIMSMLTQAFRYAYEPLVFSTAAHDREGQNKVYADAMKFFIIFALLAFLAVMFYLDILKFIIGRTYWEGLKVVPIVMMAEIFMGVYFNLSFWYKLTDQTWWGAVFSFIGCAVLLAINFIFVPSYGYMACAWGGFAGYGTCMLLSYFIGQKKSPINYPLGEIGLYVLLAAVLYVIYLYVDSKSLPLWLSLCINTVLIGIYLTYLIKKDLPLASLPVVGKYFKKN